jgi:putative endopeptidase
MADLKKLFVEATKLGDNPFSIIGEFMRTLKNSTKCSLHGDVNLGLGRDYYQKNNEENTKTIGQTKIFLTKIIPVLDIKICISAKK